MRAEEYHHFENLALQEFYHDLGVDKIQGHEEIKNTIYVDQSSIGKTPRSCPATFVNVFDKIRILYAGTTEAKYLGFTTSYFSFNSDKGACPACSGYGYKKIELQFLPDTYVPCELCHGQRYKPEILAIKWKGKTISEVLDMYISDALEFFGEIDHIRDELQLLCDIGLGYLRMGQSAHTLSGGESQRLKLVKHLLKDYRGHSVYFLDEPTVGLHMSDIEKLLRVLKVFLERGDTILMIEHDQNILKYADYIIRLENGKLVKEE
jgi:excinuclease ABC subunit A